MARLLEVIEIAGKDYNMIVKHVKTRSKTQIGSKIQHIRNSVKSGKMKVNAQIQENLERSSAISRRHSELSVFSFNKHN